MRRVLAFFVLAAALLLLVACAAPAGAPAGGAGTGAASAPAAAGAPKSGGTLTVVLDGEIDTIDPHKSVTIVGNQVWPNIYESLVVQGPGAGADVTAAALLDDVLAIASAR